MASGNHSCVRAIAPWTSFSAVISRGDQRRITWKRPYGSTWVQTTALIWLAYDLTGMSRWPAILSAAQMFPTFALGLWGGILADRIAKRSLLLGTQLALLVLAVMLAVMVLAGNVTCWHLLAVALVSGVVNAIDLPTRLAFVMDMVGREDVVNAVALNSLLFNLARGR